MGVIYSGQSIMNTTIDGSTMSSLSVGLKNALVNAGWTVIKDGSSDNIWRVRTAATPLSLQGDLWIRNASYGSTNITVNASSINSTSYNTSGFSMSDSNINVGSGFTYQCIVNPYYFYLFRTAVPSPSGGSFMMCVPYIPPFLQGLVTEAVYAACPSGSGSGVYSVTEGLNGGTGFYSQLNGWATNGNAWSVYSVSSYNKPVWLDGSCDYYEPRIIGATQSSGNKGVGYLWDALVVNLPIPRNTIIPYDGGSWLVITEGIDPGLMVKIG